MLRSLIRWKFVDRTWGFDDLNSIAEFWLRLYDEADHPPEKAWESHQTLELHLTGFPRSATIAVSNEFARRLSDAGIPVEVSTADPDTLVAKTKPREGNRPAYAGLGIHTLADALFDGMLIEIRFTVAEAGATEQVRGLVGAALVVVGELRDGAVKVKTLWCEPAFCHLKDPWQKVSGWEAHLLGAFDHYRSHNTVKSKLARDIFNRLLRWPVRGIEGAFQRFKGWLIHVPFGRPRLNALAWRFAACAAGAVVFLTLLIVCVTANSGGDGYGCLIFPLIILAIPWFIFAYEFLQLESHYYNELRKQRKASFDSFYRTVTRYAALPPNDPRPWADDPVVRKLMAEILEAGFVHAGDAVSIPIESANLVHRVFLAPDGFTYLTLCFEHSGGVGAERWHRWPATFTTLCQTFTADDFRFETSSEEFPLVALKRKDPAVRSFVLPPTTHPLDLYQSHVKTVEQCRKEERIVLCPHEPFQSFIERQIEISRHERKLYRSQPYSKRDHTRWYLQHDATPSESGK